LDTNYRLRKAQSAEKKELKEAVQWTKKFPVQELIKRGQIDRPADSVETVERLLDFFGFGNIEAWEKYYGNRLIHYRHSHSFNSHFEDIVTWLRIGQITANHESTPLFNMKCFRESLIEIRRLTVEKTSVFQARMKEICHQAGVCLVFVPPIGRIRLSGAAHWLTPHRPIIQMSLRYKTNDHFWFTFFHEVAHLLLHSKKEPFIDIDNDPKKDRMEVEADRYAANILIPKSKWNQLKKHQRYSRHLVVAFAQDIGIAPGIAVGRLQHENLIPTNQFNRLKEKYEWTPNR